MESEPSLGLVEVRRSHADGFDRKEAAALLRLALPDLKPKLASKYLTSSMVQLGSRAALADQGRPAFI
jgi:hypothetical protein